MTDQTIPADEVRKIIAAHRDGASGKGGLILAALKDLLPAPPRPTLADMTPEERRECRWMQADTESEGRTVILQPNASVGRALMLDQEANLAYAACNEVTPRPDLPRVEWPDGQKPAPALPDGWRLADHPDHGRVIVTTPTPDDDGDVYFAFPVDDLTGYDWDACGPDMLTYIDGPTTEEAGNTTGPNAVAVGGVWDDADALNRACHESERDQIVVVDKRGIAGVWDTGLRSWRASSPNADFAPYTIIHAGRKADQ